MNEPKPMGKPFDIDKGVVWEAYRRVAVNKGAPGVDEVSISGFAQDLKGNLYKIWNRLSSGTYFPPPVRAVEIPKPHGPGMRVLGVPTVADRVAQTVVRLYLEPLVEPVFHPDSYGYRPGRNALDAVAVCRRRCWDADWVIDLDISAFFDGVPHEQILAAVDHHTDLRWIRLYIARWLCAPIQQPDGTLQERDRGTPQGSAISPLLANLFMHYAFDIWLARNHPQVRFERYCDDAVVHCASYEQAVALREASRSGWRNSGWNCTQRRPASSTARTANARAGIRSRRLRFWGMTSGPGGPRAKPGHCSPVTCPRSAKPPRRRSVTRSEPGDWAGAAGPPSNTWRD
jgi:RNA-directed DNA polymerase